ncbi:MAG: hypothetical protein H5T78_08885 [Nocardia sp.]|nr:hypothetical protein [Nocardia sp.]
MAMTSVGEQKATKYVTTVFTCALVLLGSIAGCAAFGAPFAEAAGLNAQTARLWPIVVGLTVAQVGISRVILRAMSIYHARIHIWGWNIQLYIAIGCMVASNIYMAAHQGPIEMSQANRIIIAATIPACVLLAVMNGAALASVLAYREEAQPEPTFPSSETIDRRAEDDVTH